MSHADGIAALLNDGITHVFIDADAAKALWRDDHKHVMTQIYWATWLISPNPPKEWGLRVS